MPPPICDGSGQTPLFSLNNSGHHPCTQRTPSSRGERKSTRIKKYFPIIGIGLSRPGTQYWLGVMQAAVPCAVNTARSTVPCTRFGQSQFFIQRTCPFPDAFGKDSPAGSNRIILSTGMAIFAVAARVLLPGRMIQNWRRNEKAIARQARQAARKRSINPSRTIP